MKKWKTFPNKILVNSIATQIESILEKQSKASIQIQTLGTFQVWRDQDLVPSKDWGRDVTYQLFQFFITNRHRNGLHKEQIIDQVWGDNESKSGQQNFKVALHGINKVLEPNRPSRTEPKFITRQGLTYQLELTDIWIDVESLDQLVTLGNRVFLEDRKLAQKAFYEAVNLYNGAYLPNRLYEDWSTEERERIQLLTLGALINLSESLIMENPLESVRLAQQALQIDPTWEDAYRIQMEAYIEKGNRPMAIKTYQQCEKILDSEFGLEPLPETKALLKRIQNQ